MIGTAGSPARPIIGGFPAVSKGSPGSGPLALLVPAPSAEYWWMLSAGTGHAIEELAPGECLRLLASVTVGRVGVTIDALPAVLPVNFVMSDGAVVFRTVPGTKLDAATAGAVVAFEADAYGTAESPGGWSVLVRGVARELTDPLGAGQGACASARVVGVGSWSRPLRADRTNGPHGPAHHRSARRS